MDQVYQNWENLSATEQVDFLATYPGVEPPAGVVSNFVNPPTRNDIGISVITIFLVLVVITGALRLYSRAAIVRAYRLEDYLGFASYIPFLALTAVLLRVTRVIGFMVDEWNVSQGISNQWSMYIWIYRLIYAMVMLLVKTAILLEWKNLFVPKKAKNWFFWATTVMIAINVIAYSVAIIMTCLRCHPISKIWQPWVIGNCSNLSSQKSMDVATTFVNLALDVSILLLPQPIIWKLNMTRQRRIGVSLVFSLGIFVVICAAGRIHSNIALEYSPYANTTRGGAINLLWSYGEATFVMMVWAAPGVPKAFTNQSLPARVLSTLRLWTRLGDSNKPNSDDSGRGNGNRWVQTIGGGNGKARKPTATELDLIETRNADNPEAGYDHQRGVGPEGYTPENGIWKTTILETQEDSASRKSTEPIVRRQHPWMDNK